MGYGEGIGWVGMAFIKFAITPSLMTAGGYSFWDTFLIAAITACVGVTVFYFFGTVIFSAIDKRRRKPKRLFTRSSRRTVRFISKYGLLGLALISVFLSVPIAGVLSAKFFHHPMKVLPVLYVSFTGWALILTSLSRLAHSGIVG